MNGLPSISEIADSVRRGETHPRQWLDVCLEAIEQREAEIRAWVELDVEGARRSADELAARQRRGEGLGRLSGVPVGIKDIFDVQGRPTRAGSPLREGSWPAASSDAPVVGRLRREDAVLLGKTVTTEFACFDPPVTANPLDTAHTPGGSSSGSAAALAAGMCCGALGSQTGGSITRPAVYCGVTGLKPAIGTLSTDGVVPISFHLDHPGPMARDIDDLAALWSALVDADQSPAPAEPPRLAVLTDEYWRPDDAPTSAVVAEAVERLEAAGASVRRLALPADLERVRQQHWSIMAVEAAAVHRRDFAARPGGFGECIAGLIRSGLETSACDYSDALLARGQFRQRVAPELAALDAALTPATTGPAPDRSTTGDPRFNSIWSFAGLPTCALPCGLAHGLPVGLQLIGSRSEAELLGCARWVQKALQEAAPG